MKNKYNIGLEVFTPTNDIVEVIDYEYVCGIELYYTSDGSAYPEDKLSLGPTIPQNKIDDIVRVLNNIKEPIKARTYEEWKNEKIKESINNRNINHPIWMRKVVSYLPKLRWGVRD